MTTWHKASYCGDSSNCLSLGAGAQDNYFVRESETPNTVLAVTPASLRALIRATKAGRLPSCRVTHRCRTLNAGGPGAS